MALQFDNKISAGNLITIACGVVAFISAFIYLQSDLTQVKKEQLRLEARIDRVEVEVKVNRDNVSEIKGDIRVIRQILEGKMGDRGAR